MKSAIFLCFALVQIPVFLNANEKEEEKDILARPLMFMFKQKEQNYFDNAVKEAVSNHNPENKN